MPYLQFSMFAAQVTVFAVLGLICLARISQGPWAVIGCLSGLAMTVVQMPWVVADYLVTFGPAERGLELYRYLAEQSFTLVLYGAQLIGLVLLAAAVLLGRRTTPPPAPGTASADPAAAVPQRGDRVEFD